MQLSKLFVGVLTLLTFQFAYATELADKHGWFWPNQFENEANAWIHRETTGPEIVKAFKDAGEKLDHFVCAMFPSPKTW